MIQMYYFEGQLSGVQKTLADMQMSKEADVKAAQKQIKQQMDEIERRWNQKQVNKIIL